MERGFISLSLLSYVFVCLWLTLFLQNFKSGLDISLDSVEDLRLNKSEISQASVSLLQVSKSRARK
jgi:hypothetical protein